MALTHAPLEEAFETVATLGIGPGLRITGWGVIEAWDNRLSHIADGVIVTDSRLPLAERLSALYDGLIEVIERFGRPRRRSRRPSSHERGIDAETRPGAGRGRPGAGALWRAGL
jgi:hypothetical protein